MKNNYLHSDLNARQQQLVKLLLIVILLLVFVSMAYSQTPSTENTFTTSTTFNPTIKDAIKYADLPEIKDSVKRIQNIKYGIFSEPLFPKYTVQPIVAAKIQNEPLPKLYHAIIKAGYGPIYNMPYGEVYLANTRSRENNYGLHFKHLSNTAHLENVGFGGMSNNQLKIFAKQFYKKHTLNGDVLYNRDVVRYYGYDTSVNKLSKDYTKQRYQLINPTLKLQSHYTDSTHINHTIDLSYYNLQNLHREAENNIKLNALGDMFLNGEHFTLNFLTDYYNHKQSNDTLNNLIMSLNPSFIAGTKKWNAVLGLTGTLDNFKNQTKFYFYPKLSVDYNVYENIIIPYAGIEGGLIKNSFRSLITANPFVDTTLNYTNTNNKIKALVGLRGNLSSNTTYNTRVSYDIFDSMYFFVRNYTGTNLLQNSFTPLYDNATLITINGSLKYQLKEKWNIITSGNYYIWKTKNITRAYHKPDFDLTISGIYNLESKIILKADLFIVGQQWTLSEIRNNETFINTYQPTLLKGYVDANIGAEYRYSKMLSFFAKFNNIANQRYFRFDNYPSMRFNFMLGVTFVPF
ncbi:MAG: hypothetical protein ACK5QC_14165 [Bacteroidota bacterium]